MVHLASFGLPVPTDRRQFCSMTSSTLSRPAYERLQAWAACHDLTAAVYRTTSNWPQHELYGLISQARRSAFSATANICEGATRKGSAEFRRFLNISLGSLSELGYALKLGVTLGYLSGKQETELEILRDHASRLTWGLYKAIGRAGPKDGKPADNGGRTPSRAR